MMVKMVLMVIAVEITVKVTRDLGGSTDDGEEDSSSCDVGSSLVLSVTVRLAQGLPTICHLTLITAS
jgi:hypothetical protein